MKVLGLIALILSPALAEANGFWTVSCIEESTRETVSFVLEDLRSQRQQRHFEGGAKAHTRVLPGVLYGGFSQDLITENTRLKGYYRLNIQALSLDQGAGFIRASLIIGDHLIGNNHKPFGHIQVYGPGNRMIAEYLVGCTVTN